MRALLIMAATASSLAAGSVAHAWTCSSSTCNTWCSTVPYGLSATSADLGDATTETEVRRGMDDWTLRSCTGLRTNYMGRSGARAGATDNNSVIGWEESGWPAERRFTIGLTGTIIEVGGNNCILESDMRMNGTWYTWITGPGPGGDTVNTYSIVVHEGGHYYGLDHSSQRSAAMFESYASGISMITQDDENGICTLYPGSGGGPVDCTTAGCPAGQECVDGACRSVSGSGGMCERCNDNSECGSATDACIAYPDRLGYCARSCRSSSDCDSGDECLDTTIGPQCIRLSGVTPDCTGPAVNPGCINDSQCAPDRCEGGECVAAPMTGRELGEPCENHDDCRSLRCASSPDGSICTQSCNGFDTTSCPSGFYCDGEASGSCGTGLCLRGSAGMAPLGGACELDTDCASLMCDGGSCAAPCQPGGATTCPGGTTCQPGFLAGCGACRQDGSLGAPGAHCDANEQCESGLCAVRGEDDRFCTSQCADETMCPMGFECVAIGAISICVPPADFMPEENPAMNPEESGCGCRTPGTPTNTPAWPVLLALGVLVMRRRRVG